MRHFLKFLEGMLLERFQENVPERLIQNIPGRHLMNSQESEVRSLGDVLEILQGNQY